MATGSSVGNKKKAKNYDITITTTRKLLALTDESRTRLLSPEAHSIPFSPQHMANTFMLATQMNNLELKKGKFEFPIYFCSELTKSLGAILAYCCSGFYRPHLYNQRNVFSVYYTLIVNLSGKSSVDDEINHVMGFQLCNAKLKTYQDGKSMLTAMVNDQFMPYVSETFRRQEKLLNHKYENQLAMIAYIFLVAFKDIVPIKQMLKQFAEILQLTSNFGCLELQMSEYKSLLDKTFGQAFEFRKHIFKNLVLLATREDQLGEVHRLILKELQFVKMQKFVLIEKYLKPYCPSVMNFHELKSTVVRSAFNKMEESIGKFDDCELPYFWFLEERFDIFNNPIMNFILGVALAIKQFKEPDFQLPNPWISEWFSHGIDSFYNFRKEDVFDYLRRFDLVKKAVQNHNSKS